MPSTQIQVPQKPPATIRGHILALDGVRGFAAAWVFIFHYGGGAKNPHLAIRLIGKFIDLGFAGVSIFFVLSGFLITGILWDSLGREHWWRTFFIRRALRIFPLYYLALFGAAIIALLLRAPWSSVAPIWPLFFYLQDVPHLYQYAHVTPAISLGHFWTLAVEEQFYLAWPLLLLWAARRDRAKALCIAVWTLSLLFRASAYMFHLDTGWPETFVFGRAGELVAGAFLALSLRGTEEERNRIFSIAKPLFVVALIAVVCVVLIPTPHAIGFWIQILSTHLYSVLFAATIALSLQPGLIQSFFSTATLRGLGKISYGFYVFHMLFRPLFARIVNEFFPTLQGYGFAAALAVVALAGTTVIATASFYLYETPFMRLKDRLAPSNTRQATEG